MHAYNYRGIRYKVYGGGGGGGGGVHLAHTHTTHTLNVPWQPIWIDHKFIIRIYNIITNWTTQIFISPPLQVIPIQLVERLRHVQAAKKTAQQTAAVHRLDLQSPIEKESVDLLEEYELSDG